MSSFNQRECLGCGQPCDGYHCYSCTCQQCGVILLNGICINCIYRDGKPVTCCECEGPLRGGFCLFCNSKAENSFTYDPDSFDDTSSNFNHFPQPQYETNLCELCENDSHYGYDCQPQFPFVYKQEPSYNQNYNDNHYPHNSSSFLCCNNWGYSDIHQPSKEISIDELKVMMQSYFERTNQSREQEELLAEQKLREQEQAAQEKEEPPQNSDIRQQLYCMHNDVDDLIESALNFKLLSINLNSQRIDKEKKEVKNIVEQLTKRRTRITESLQNFKVIHKKSSISLNNTSQISPVNAIAPALPTEEPEYSLSMGYEHPSTILKTESDEVIESSVKNLVQIPSEYEVTFDDETMMSLSNEDVPMENFKVYSNPLFDDGEINSDNIDLHYINAESNLIESLLNRDTLIDSSLKFDFLLNEFSGELAHINPILPGIKEADFDLEEEIRLVENLLYDNSSPRPPEELNAEITDTIFESLSPSPIPVKDSDSLMDDIYLFFATDDLLPPRIESNDYDSEGDIHFLEELLVNDSISLPKNESSYFDHHDDPLFPRPPLEPPDVESFFDFEPNSGELISAVKNNIDELNEDECFDP
nr:hypothetical protein [Tanacetum cinerariifolium]